MTSIRYRRCVHCQDTYEYQLSGWGAGKHNHPDYCPECQEACVKALKVIPVKFQRRKMPVTSLPPAYHQVTREVVEAWEVAKAEKDKAENKLHIQQIGVGMFNLQTGDHMSVRVVVALDGPHQGTRFWISTWDKSPEGTIEVEAEYDVVNDRVTGLWKNYSRTV